MPRRQLKKAPRPRIRQTERAMNADRPYHWRIRNRVIRPRDPVAQMLEQPPENWEDYFRTVNMEPPQTRSVWEFGDFRRRRFR